MKRLVFLVLFGILFCTPAFAQSACTYIAPGAVLTAGQWNACFEQKLNVNGSALGAGGINTQLQYNQNGALSGVGSATYSGDVLTLASPVLITPNLGTPSALTLTNANGLPISTGVSGLGGGVAAALANTAGQTGGFSTIIGPNSSTSGDLVVWNNSSGTLLADVAPNELNVAAYGAVGNGTTDDTAAINGAITACAALQGRLVFDSSKTYVIKRASPSSQLGGLRLLPGCSLDGQGATLLLQDNASFIYGASAVTGTATVTANNSAGNTTITVGGGLGGCVAGQSALYRLADDPSDSTETNYFGFAQIVSTTSTSITIDNPLPAATNIAGVTNPANKTITCFSSVLSNLDIKNFNLVTGGSGNPEEGIVLLYAQNIRISNIWTTNPGAGAINTQYSNGIYASNIHVLSSQNYASGSKGTVITANETLAFNVNNLYAENFVNALLSVGFSSQVSVTNIVAYNSNSSNSYQLLLSAQTSHLKVDGLNVVGVGGYLLDSTGGTTSFVQIRNAYIQASSDLYYAGVAGVDVVGKYYYNVNGTLEYYDFDHPEETDITIPLTNGMNSYFLTQPGPVARSYLYTSSGVTGGDIADLTIYLGRRSASLASGDNGSQVMTETAGSQIVLPTQDLGSVGGAFWSYRALPVALLVQTSGSDFGSNKFLTLRTFTYPNLSTTSLSMTDPFVLAQSTFNPGISYTFTAPQTFTNPTINGTTTLAPTTISGLPSCASGNKGAIAFVSDTTASGAAAFHGAVSGSGSTTVNSLVSCNGSNWQYD